jgi:hypothetical protein
MHVFPEQHPSGQDVASHTGYVHEAEPSWLHDPPWPQLMVPRSQLFPLEAPQNEAWPGWLGLQLPY